MTQLSSNWTIKINQLSDLYEKVLARKDSVLVFDGIEKGEKTTFRIGITYTGGKYNILFSYNDSKKFGTRPTGIKLPLYTKTTKEEVIEFLSSNMMRLGLKDKLSSSLLDYTEFPEIDALSFLDKKVEKTYNVVSRSEVNEIREKLNTPNLDLLPQEDLAKVVTKIWFPTVEKMPESLQRPYLMKLLVEGTQVLLQDQKDLLSPSDAEVIQDKITNEFNVYKQLLSI